MNSLKFKALHPDAKLPTYGSAGAACFDIHSAGAYTLHPGCTLQVKTELAVEVPQGWALLIHSRSGMGAKRGVRLANCTGVIDSDYRGEVVVMLRNDGNKTLLIEPGDRIAQGMLTPTPQMRLVLEDELSETVRGAGGFGSTGA